MLEKIPFFIVYAIIVLVFAHYADSNNLDSEKSFASIAGGGLAIMLIIIGLSS